MLPKITQTEISIATAVLKAASLRESSFDNAAADAATIANEKEEAEFKTLKPDAIFYGGVNYATFYTMTLEEACDQAATEGPGAGLGRLIYLALDSWWNDTVSWAEQILDPTATTSPTSKQCQHGISYTSTANLPLEEDSNELPEDTCKKCAELYEKKRIPSWSKAMVSNWRKKANIPATISDKAIFDIVQKEGYSGLDNSDETILEIEMLREELGLNIHIIEDET